MGATIRQWLTVGDGIDRLQENSVPQPQPAPREVLVRIEAVSLNYRDLLVINGESTWRPLHRLAAGDHFGKIVLAAGS